MYSSSAFPAFIQPASNHVGERCLREDMHQSCTNLSIEFISTEMTSSLSNFYHVRFSFTGVPSLRPLNWLHLAEIRFSDEEIPSTFTTTPTTTTDEHASSSTISNDQPTRGSLTTTMDEPLFGSNSLESGDGQGV